MAEQVDVSGVKKLWPFGAALLGFVGIIWSAATEVSGIQAAQSSQALEINHLETLEGEQQTSLFGISTQLAALSQQVADIKYNQNTPSGGHE